MKIIEGMKEIKMNKEKIADLQTKIGENSAFINHETPLYGDATAAKVSGWIQSCCDLTKRNVALLFAIQKTNIETTVTINIPLADVDRGVRKTIAEWIWRRREYAMLDHKTWRMLTDRGIKEGFTKSPTGGDVEIKIVRYYDPVIRDGHIVMYKSEPHLIDAALEIVNATTDLIGLPS